MILLLVFVVKFKKATKYKILLRNLSVFLVLSIATCSTLFYGYALLVNGNKQYESGNYKAAAKNIERSISIASLFKPLTSNINYGGLYLRVGKSYYEIENYEKARNAFEKALAIEPNNKAILDLLEKLKT